MKTGRMSVVALLAWTAPLSAAAQTGTDIYLARIAGTGAALTLSAPQNITARAGYDNQPHFTADGRALLYTVAHDDGQTEIHRFEIEPGRTLQVTRTAESEYSATPLPDGGFSAVRVEQDSTQRLWRFRADGTAVAPVLDLAPVGYHAWLDEHTLVLFVLGQPSTLRIADTRTGGVRILAERIGRSLHRIPGSGRASFVQRVDSTLHIAAYDPVDGGFTVLAGAPPAAGADDVPWTEADHAWMPDGTLVAARGKRMYLHGPGGWRAIAHFPDLPGSITRIAVSPDGAAIAFVVDEPSR